MNYLSWSERSCFAIRWNTIIISIIPDDLVQNTFTESHVPLDGLDRESPECINASIWSCSGVCRNSSFADGYRRVGTWSVTHAGQVFLPTLDASYQRCVFLNWNFNWSIQQHKWPCLLSVAEVVHRWCRSHGLSIKARIDRPRISNGHYSNKFNNMKIFGFSVRLEKRVLLRAFLIYDAFLSRSPID